MGVWVGPRTPGTAYNLLHHALGEIEGVSGLWGHVKGGMGAISQALARGVHRFDLEPLGTDGTRLVHTLDAQLGGPLRLAARPLLRMHDLVIEDLLDRAELATGGRPPRAAPLPRWMRAMNAVEQGLGRAGGSLSAARRSRPSSA